MKKPILLLLTAFLMQCAIKNQSVKIITSATNATVTIRPEQVEVPN